MGKKFWTGMIGLLVVALAIGALMVFGADSGGDAAVYFPLKTGNTWIYKASLAGENKAVTIKIKVTEPENGNPKVIVYDPAGNAQAFINYVQNDQGLFKAKQMGVSRVFEYQPLWQVLSSNMTPGSTWSWESGDHKMKETSKVLNTEKVTVPAGSFNALVIQCNGINEDGHAYNEKTWWVKNFGYVKDEYTVQGQTIICELSEYKLEK